MKKYLLLILIIILMACTVQSASTLQELTDKFRVLIQEMDTLESVCTDSAVKVWYNLSQDKIVPMGGYIEKATNYIYYDDSEYVMPSTFKRVKDVWLKSDGDWYPMYPNIPETKESKVSKYGVSWVSPDTAKMRVIPGEVVATYIDFVFSEDSTFYIMPSNYKSYLYATYWVTATSRWWPIFENVGFNKDTTAKNGFVFEKHPDTNLYLFKGTLAVDEDTIRIAYMRSIDSGDTIEVQYYGTAIPLDSAGATSEVPSNLEGFLLQEMYYYYLRSLKEYNAGNSEWEKLRIDMGLLKPKGTE
jgi:hypothetical protein